MNTENEHLRKFGAIYFLGGLIRKITFEARDVDEARQLATKWGFGLEGEAQNESDLQRDKEVEPKAYDVPSSLRLLGGISRTSLYRLLGRRILKRLPGTRRILVTRASIDRYCAGA